MNTTLLEEKWKRIDTGKITEYKSLRISNDCAPDLYLGYNKNVQRCLILDTAGKVPLDFPPLRKQYISIEFFKKTSLIVIQLYDGLFNELFNHLVISIYNRIKDVGPSSEAAHEFIQTFHKWTEFFDDGYSPLLSEETVRGLFGEVAVLNDLLKHTASTYINAVLASWQGPYDAVHDFITEGKDLEVKTKDISGADIRISSEYQLQIEAGKELELIVVSIIKDINGYSLSELLSQTKELIAGKFGDLSVLLKALAKKNLSFRNLTEYDSLRYRLKNISTYNCLHQNFPRITRADLSDLVHHVNYSIRISALDDFIISNKDY